MSHDWLWAVWFTFSFGGFAFLEWAALSDRLDIQPLTYWCRYALVHFGWAAAMFAGAFLFWFAWHLVFEPIIKASRRIREAMKEEQ